MRLFLRHLITLCCVALAACQPAPKFTATDITGGKAIGGEFTLQDATGARRLSEFKGKAVLVFFGFTHCPDVCPTGLVDYANTLKKLGDKAKDVQVLFITVDPERDTPQRLAQYVQAFHPSFIGLSGDAAQIKTVADLHKVFYQKVNNASKASSASYSMDHTAAAYVYDKTGAIRLYVKQGQSAETLAKDLAQLL